jgi:3-hydroxyisobutyrate dehydrogenase-like beta-hydroxyacid dehydrogenase
VTGAVVGLVHPGTMGATVGLGARLSGARVLWASEDRSPATRQRALAQGLENVETLSALVAQSEIILSVCPPESAVEVGAAVAALGFQGLYVDCNAIAPDTARRIADLVARAGAGFVDGGIIGPATRTRGRTRLYLAGREAGRVAALFERGPIEPVVLEGAPGAASALKMAYAAYTKGTAALLAAIRAFAVREGVDQALLAEWKQSLPDLPAQAERAVAQAAPKAWRFAGEMEEIAEALEAAGLPPGFHRAAADVYRRLLRYRDAPLPPAEEVARTLLDRASAPTPQKGAET